MRAAATLLCLCAALAAPAAAGVGDTTQAFRTSDGHALTLSGPDAEALTRWASFVGSLPHGAEMSGVTVSFVAPAALHEHCGPGLACYFPNSRTIFVPTEPVAGWPVEHLIAHEYGHHLAAHRENPPFGALLGGTRRWATYMRICDRLMDGTVTLRTGLPNDVGEAFAESYRELASRRGTGWPAAPRWDHDYRLMPDDGALAAIEQDVLQPWQPSVIRSFRGRILRAGQKIRLAFEATLDGTTAARLIRAPRGATVRFVGTKSVARVGATAEYDACGGGTVRLELTAPRAGAYTLAVLG